MLDFCRNSNLFILNGRIGDSEHNAKFTCKDKSTVDYFLSTSYLLDSLNTFEVLDFCSLLSDAHCPISINLEVDPEHQHKNTSRVSNKTSEVINQWDAQKADHFVENFDKKSISKIDCKLSLMLQNETMEQNDSSTKDRRDL